MLCVLAIAAGVFIVWVYPFLARTDRVDCKVLVVEGWVHEYAIQAAAKEFASGHYQRVFTTGGPVAGTGGYTNDYNPSASVGADLLKAAGIPAARLQMVPSRIMQRDRTYGTAVALRHWFQEQAEPTTGINVLTEGPHARRTQMLFAKAFKGEVSVGVIGVHNPDYDPKRWWRYSEGVKEVIGETMAYLYARLLFSAK